MKIQLINILFNKGLAKPILLGLILSLCSCEDFVEVDLPETQLTGRAIFEDGSTVNAAFTSIYAKMRDNALVTGSPSGISNLMAYYADEQTYYSPNMLPQQEFYQNNVLPSNSLIENLWGNSYGLVYAANSILEGIEGSESLSEQEKASFKGEALFVRAYVHFYLVNLFGKVPYVRVTDYQVNTHLSRLPIEEVYQQILADLELAEELMSNVEVPENTRPGIYTIKALMARVYLYTENWEKAREKATQVINNPDLYFWEPLVEGVFLKDSPSTLWQLAEGQEGSNTLEGQTFIFMEGPPPTGALSESLVNAFEEEDSRRIHWIREVEGEGEIWYHAYKYKENNVTGSTMENSILFRLAEVYLIRAEANAHLNNLGAALEDLNKTRIRANLAEINLTTSEDILDAIVQERRLELFTELGHRYFDLKRIQKAQEVLEPLKPDWEATDIHLPLPEQELLANPNIQPQNPGY